MLRAVYEVRVSRQGCARRQPMAARGARYRFRHRVEQAGIDEKRRDVGGNDRGRRTNFGGATIRRIRTFLPGIVVRHHERGSLRYFTRAQPSVSRTLHSGPFHVRPVAILLIDSAASATAFPRMVFARLDGHLCVFRRTR